MPIEEGRCGMKTLGNANQLQEIMKIIDYNYVGNIISIKAVGIPEFSLTPEHRVRIVERKRDRLKILHYSKDEQWKKCNELATSFWQSDCLVFPKYKIYSKNSKIDLSKYHHLKTHKSRSIILPLSRDAMAVLGLFLAEGWVTETEKDTLVCWSLDKKEEETLAKKIQEFLPKIGLTAVIRPSKSTPNGIVVVCHSKQLGIFLTREFGHRAHNKKIPDFIMNTSDENVKTFLKYAIFGDGCFYGEQKLTFYCTTSPSVAFQIQKLFSKLDIFINIYTRAPKITDFNGRKIHQRKTFILILSKRPSESFWGLTGNKTKQYNTIGESSNAFYLPIKRTFKMNYNGKIYNYETLDKTFQINNVIVHNSDYGYQKLCVCRFLNCTLTELKNRITNPADYMTILAYLSEEGERINASSNLPPSSRGSFQRQPSVRR